MLWPAVGLFEAGPGLHCAKTSFMHISERPFAASNALGTKCTRSDVSKAAHLPRCADVQLSKVQQAVEVVQKKMRAYDGSFVQFRADEKVGYLLLARQTNVCEASCAHVSGCPLVAGAAKGQTRGSVAA